MADKSSDARIDGVPFPDGSRRIPLGFWRPVNTDNPDLPPTDEQVRQQSAEFAESLMARIREVQQARQEEADQVSSPEDADQSGAGQ
jgi:hypothetical protein